MKWREERGSAFLLVVFMILLFAMLGVAVLGASIGGAQRSQKAEDNVQTVHLADKALSEAVAQVMADFDNQAIEPNQLRTQLEAFVRDFKDTGNRDSDLDVAKAPGYRIERICIVGTPNCGDPGGGTGSAQTPTSDMLKVTAIAEVNGMRRELTQTITLNTYPDFLKYAMGSEGEVTINGAPLIMNGGIYSGGQLKLRNLADYTYHGNSGLAATQFLYLSPDLADNPLPCTIGSGIGQDGDREKLFVQKYDDVLYREDNDPNYTPVFTETYNCEQFHGLRKEEVTLTETKKFISIDVAQSFIDKAVEALNPDPNSDLPTSIRDELSKAYRESPDPANALMTKIKEDLGVFYTDFASDRYVTIPFAPPEPGPLASDADRTVYQQRKAQYDAAMAEVNEKLGHMSGPIYVDGDLKVGKELKQLLYAEKGPNDWLIVNGNLTVQNDAAGTDIPVTANMLVKGKVALGGSLSMDATLFSLDEQENEIVDAHIGGKGLVLIANGPISVYRVDSFQPLGGGYKPDSANTLNAFFYTDKQAELYGVGSLFWIHGGFFAKKSITINAVLGNTSEAQGQNDLVFDDPADHQAGLTEKQARFVIDYDDDVFINQKIGLPRVDRIKVTVGPKKLKSMDGEG
ncbi:hypothetical protein [Paenibacillus glycinis]|uniref:Uncharacterized protein n=1 Tax=Paenibacillus glycinis TaxID=2697035 RepID=A0ABW9XRS9_9BACL|nr:hypothetical protein [Paenibacillus glycinis]NBD25351.1 hypothetical protein [Paenibacillus glycinis]